MKKTTLFNFLAVTLFCLFSLSCREQKKTENNGGLYVIDVLKKYPKKTIKLQNIANISYIALDSESDDYIVASRPQVLTDKYIIIYGHTQKDFLIFDREGKPYHHFSKLGNGPGEYQSVTKIAYDENAEELFVSDFHLDKILVYNLKGDFLRELDYGKEHSYKRIYNYDQDNLLCYDAGIFGSQNKPSYVLLSKENWEVESKIKLPFEEIRTLSVRRKIEGGESISTAQTYPAIKSLDTFFLVEISSDTLYKYTMEKELLPFLVREPAIESMDNPVYIRGCLETSQYLFMSIITIVEKEESGSNFRFSMLALDKLTGDIYEPEVVNESYPAIKNFQIGPDLIDLAILPNHGLATLKAEDLVEAYEEDGLQGELKDIASKLKIDDNDVLMLLEFK